MPSLGSTPWHWNVITEPLNQIRRMPMPTLHVGLATSRQSTLHSPLPLPQLFLVLYSLWGKTYSTPSNCGTFSLMKMPSLFIEAKQDFESALVCDPRHLNAQKYLQSAREKVRRNVHGAFLRARKK